MNDIARLLEHAYELLLQDATGRATGASTIYAAAKTIAVPDKTRCRAIAAYDSTSEMLAKALLWDGREEPREVWRPALELALYRQEHRLTR